MCAGAVGKWPACDGEALRHQSVVRLHRVSAIVRVWPIMALRKRFVSEHNGVGGKVAYLFWLRLRADHGAVMSSTVHAWNVCAHAVL